jgi:hypothetical protein
MSESSINRTEPTWYFAEQEDSFVVQIWKKYDFLLVIILVLFVDLLTPYLIWQRILPSATRWLADGLVAGLLAITMARMLVQDRIPKGMAVIIGATILWSMVATFEGQPAIATIWGWWRIFKYPTIAVFLLLQQGWFENMGSLIVKGIIAILTFEVLFQFLQWLGGEVPGDNLAGSFGRNGVAPFLFFILFALCVALGNWLVTGKAKMLIYVIVLGAVASGFGEMKVFPVAMIALGLIALCIHMIRGGHIKELFIYIGLFAIIAPAFVTFYNVVVADARGTRRFEEYFDLDTTENYLNNVDYNTTTGQTYLGRGFALSLGWQIIQRDTTTFLFGYGLGARGESVSLGIVGQGLATGDYGLTTGSSLLVMMQEFGVVGLGVLAVIMIWLVLTLFQQVRLSPKGDDAVLRYAIILFSIMWPFWLYYHKVWDFAVVMLIYWSVIGYLLSHPPQGDSK